PLPLLFEAVEERTVATEGFVRDHPVEANGAWFLSSLQQLGSHLRLRAKANLFRNANLLAPLAIGTPLLGQIQLTIEQRHPPGSNPGQEDADLTILGLAQAAAVLSFDADTLGPFLGKTRAVDDTDGANRPGHRRGSQFLDKDLLNFVLDVLEVPTRVG